MTRCAPIALSFSASRRICSSPSYCCARDELAETGYTLHFAGSGQTAVLDGSKVSEFMYQTGMTEYLLAVLTSFVRAEHWHYRYPKPDGTFARRKG